MPNNDVNRISEILQANADKNFVQRIMKPDTNPVLMNWNGPDTWGTHAMSYATRDNGAMVYPTIVQMPDGTLRKLEGREAMDHAIKTNEFIQFDTPEEADWFGKNYKQIWGQK